MKIAHKVMKIDTMNKNYQTKYDRNKKRIKIWENYVGLIQVEVNHTYPELYTAGAVLVIFLFGLFYFIFYLTYLWNCR